MMIDTIFKIILVGLELWQHAEATKYITQVTNLRTQYHDEDNKPPGVRNDALIDDIRFQLLNLADAFAAEVAASKTAA